MKYCWSLLVIWVLVGCGANQPVPQIPDGPDPIEALQTYLNQLDSAWVYQDIQVGEPQPWHSGLLVVYGFTQTKEQQSREGVGYAVMRLVDNEWSIDRGETTGSPDLMYSITIIRDPLKNLLYGRTGNPQAVMVQATTANNQVVTAPITATLFRLEIPDNLATVELLDLAGNPLP